MKSAAHRRTNALQRGAAFALLARQLFILVGVLRTRRFLTRMPTVAAVDGTRPKMLVVVPVLREPAVADMVEHLSSIVDEPADLIVVTTERERPTGGAVDASTVDITAALAARRRCTHLHAPTADGVKSDQLNWAVTRLAARHPPDSTYLVIFDADSRPDYGILDHFRRSIAQNPDAPVLHTSSRFELRFRRPAGSSFGLRGLAARLVCDASALRANRFVAGFEVPRLLARAGSQPRAAASRAVFAHVTGHGLCVRLDFLRDHPLPPRDVIEDMHWSYHRCVERTPMVAVPHTDRSEVPDTVTAQFRQARRWFSGPGRSFEYYTERPGNEPLAAVVALSGIGAAAEWIGCAFIPAWVATRLATTRIDAVTRTILGGVTLVGAAQLVLTEITLGSPDPVLRRIGRIVAAPAALTVHGIGGIAGAVDIARGRRRFDKTER